MWALVLLPLESEIALYFTLGLILILSGIGLPVPEEVTLILGGYLAYLGFVDYWKVMYVLIAGIIVADIFGYWLGRFAGTWASKRLSRSKVMKHFLEKAHRYFEKYGEMVIIFSRALIGVRVVIPLLAGHFRMNFLKFVIFDVIGAIPWTFALVSIAYYFGLGLETIGEIKEFKHALFFGIGIFILFCIGIAIIKKQKRKRASPVTKI